MQSDNAQECWSVGLNQQGQQGDHTLNESPRLRLIKSLQNVSIQNMSHGWKSATYLVNKNQKLIVFGYNNQSQLGITSKLITFMIVSNWNGKTEAPQVISDLIFQYSNSNNCNGQLTVNNYSKSNQLFPISIQDFDIKYISNGMSRNRVIITQENEMYAAGDNYCCQFGDLSKQMCAIRDSTNTEDSNVIAWTKIDYFNENDINIKQVECSWQYITYLSDTGQVYVAGTNYQGGLGFGDWKNEIPKIEKMSHIQMQIGSICSGDSHTLALTKYGGKVLSWGDNTYGQLGHGDDGDARSRFPKEIAFFSENNITVTKVVCGSQYNVCLDSDGYIYSFGDNRKGQCGVIKNDNKNGRTCERYLNVPCLNGTLKRNEFIVDIKCGLNHSVAKSSLNEYYLWGDNQFCECLVQNFVRSREAYYVQIPTKFEAKHFHDRNQEISCIYVGHCVTRVIVTSKIAS